MTLLEVCVDSAEGLQAAWSGGADRIELCAALSEGGLTPSAGLVHQAAALPLPVYAMIRPRGGDFCYAPDEVAVMRRDIAEMRRAGLAGVVLGAATPEGALHAPLLRQLSQDAGGMGRTLHRVIDTVADPLPALETAIALGFERVLTSGGAATAMQGAALIARMVGAARGRLSVMAGAGVTPDTAAELVARTQVRELHASCRGPRAELGRCLPSSHEPPSQVTDGALVRALKSAVG